MSYVKLINPTLAEDFEESYSSFLKIILKSLNTYIELNRSLIMHSESNITEKINQDINDLIDNNIYLRKYLSYANFKRKVNKMIMSNEDSSYCSRKMILEELGDGIKRLRKSNNITMKQLAATTNVSVSYISKIENYYITNPPKCMFIHNVTILYDCDIEYIFGIINSPKCCGDLPRKPIKMVSDSDYPLFLASSEYTDITEMLKTIYCSRDPKAKESLYSFLVELTGNMENG